MASMLVSACLILSGGPPVAEAAKPADNPVGTGSSSSDDEIRYSEDREAIARGIATERGAELVPSYDHPDIIAGQGEQFTEMPDAAGLDGLLRRGKAVT